MTAIVAALSFLPLLCQSIPAANIDPWFDEEPYAVAILAKCENVPNCEVKYDPGHQRHITQFKENMGPGSAWYIENVAKYDPFSVHFDSGLERRGYSSSNGGSGNGGSSGDSNGGSQGGSQGSSQGGSQSGSQGGSGGSGASSQSPPASSAAYQPPPESSSANQPPPASTTAASVPSSTSAPQASSTFGMSTGTCNYGTTTPSDALGNLESFCNDGSQSPNGCNGQWSLTISYVYEDTEPDGGHLDFNIASQWASDSDPAYFYQVMSGMSSGLDQNITDNSVPSLRYDSIGVPNEVNTYTGASQYSAHRFVNGAMASFMTVSVSFEPETDNFCDFISGILGGVIGEIPGWGGPASIFWGAASAAACGDLS